MIDFSSTNLQKLYSELQALLGLISKPDSNNSTNTNQDKKNTNNANFNNLQNAVSSMRGTSESPNNATDFFGSIDEKTLKNSKDIGVKALLQYRDANNLDLYNTDLTKQEVTLMNSARADKKDIPDIREYNEIKRFSESMRIPEIERVAKYFGIKDTNAFKDAIDSNYGKNYVDQKTESSSSLPNDPRINNIKQRIKLTADEEKAVAALFKYRKDKGLDKYPHSKTSYEDYLVLKTHGMSRKRANEFMMHWSHDTESRGSIDPKLLKENSKDAGIKALLTYRKMNKFELHNGNLTEEEVSLMNIARENKQKFNVDYSKLMKADYNLQKGYNFYLIN